MAAFVRATGDAKTPIQWSNQIFRNSLKAIETSAMLGAQGSGKAVVVDTRLKAKPGDTIRYPFIPYTQVNPLVGQDTTILGNERSLADYSVDLVVDEINFPYRKRGKMTDQRILFSARDEMHRQIEQNCAQYNDDQIFRILSGYSGPTDTAVGTDRVNGAGRCAICTGTSGASVVTEANSDTTAIDGAGSTTDKMNVKAIEDALIIARQTGTYKVTPMSLGKDNVPVYILYVSLKAARDLRRDPEWQNHALELISLGLPHDLLGMGTLGVWNNVIVKSSERVLEVTTAGTDYYARNLLVGADAMCLGWAQTTQVTEELIDHDRELSVNGSEIRGETKLAFNGVDLGVLQLISASN